MPPSPDKSRLTHRVPVAGPGARGGAPPPNPQTPKPGCGRRTGCFRRPLSTQGDGPEPPQSRRASRLPARGHTPFRGSHICIHLHAFAYPHGKCSSFSGSFQGNVVIVTSRLSWISLALLTLLRAHPQSRSVCRGCGKGRAQRGAGAPSPPPGGGVGKPAQLPQRPGPPSSQHADRGGPVTAAEPARRQQPHRLDVLSKSHGSPPVGRPCCSLKPLARRRDGQATWAAGSWSLWNPFLLTVFPHIVSLSSCQAPSGLPKSPQGARGGQSAGVGREVKGGSSLSTPAWRWVSEVQQDTEAFLLRVVKSERRLLPGGSWEREYSAKKLNARAVISPVSSIQHSRPQTC